MTLGTGIFLSALFLGTIFLYHSTKDRWNWTKGMKRLAFLVVGLIVIGSVTGLYGKYNKGIAPAWKKAPVVYTSFWGIELGSKKADVLFLKGKPSSKKKADKNEPGYWSYKTMDELWVIFFNEKERVSQVLLLKGRYLSGDLGGIHIGDSLGYLEGKYGPPDEITENKDKTARIYNYKKLNLKYVLEKAAVVVMGVKRFSD